MRYLAAIFATLAVATHAIGQIGPPIKYEIESDFQQTQELPDQTFQQGASVEMHFFIYSAGRYLSLDGLTADWYGQETITSTQRLEQASVTTVTNSTPNYFRVKLDSGATGTPRTNWVWSLVLQETDMLYQYPIGTGSLNIVESSWTGAQAELVTPTVETYLENRLDGVEDEIEQRLIDRYETGDPTNTNAVDRALSSDATLDDLQDITDNGAVTTNTITVGGVQFSTTNTALPAEGELAYVDDQGGVVLGMPNGSYLTVGAEGQVRVYNDTGTTLANGTLVTFAGQQGHFAKVIKVSATTVADAGVVAMVTSTNGITDGHFGQAALWGRVRSVPNMTGIDNRTQLYLSSVDGEFTTNAPSYPAEPFVIGKACAVSGDRGDIELRLDGWKTWGQLDDRYAVRDSDETFSSLAVTNDVTADGGSVSLTGTAATADGALQRSGTEAERTMGNDLVMGENAVLGQRFGHINNVAENASGTAWLALGGEAAVNASGDEWAAIGRHTGYSSTGNQWYAMGYYSGDGAQGDGWATFGRFSGQYAIGDNWHSFGRSGILAIHTNSVSFGRFSGYKARGNNRMYMDVYATAPNYAADGATNDTIFLDNDGHLYLGGGTGRAENPSAGGTLRGDWTTTRNLTATSYSITDNRQAIPTAITIPTNSTYTISYTNGQFTSYSFGAGTEPITITVEGPGDGYRSQHEIYFESGYTNRLVTYTNTAGGLRWINDAPTTDEAQIMFVWTGTNAAAINTTVVE